MKIEIEIECFSLFKPFKSAPSDYEVGETLNKEVEKIVFFVSPANPKTL